MKKSIILKEQINPKDSLRIKVKSGDKDERGKHLKEIKVRAENDVFHRIDIDRSGEKTKVIQKVWKNNKLVHEHDKSQK